METATKIIKILEQLKDFFVLHNVGAWTSRTHIAIQQINERKLNIKTILNDFVAAGMGSIIDLYICSDNGHHLEQNEAETNKQLANFIKQLLTIKNGLDKR
jgi:hypothetical protein